MRRYKFRDSEMKRPYILYSALLLIASCSSVTTKTGTLFPVGGPIIEQKPVQAISITITNAHKYSGDTSLVMPVGDECSGKWAATSGAYTSSKSLNLISTYSGVYGSSSYQSSGSSMPGTAFLLCQSGLTIDVEVLIGKGGSGFGYARDSKGSIYKVIF